MIKTVADLTGVTVDHYAEIGLLGFALIADALGGVDVCLKEPVYEPLSGADFPAGRQSSTVRKRSASFASGMICPAATWTGWYVSRR